MKKTPVVFHHHFKNNFLVISVAAAVIYVHAHVSVPFHRICREILILHQILLEKIVQVSHQLIRPIIVVEDLEVFIDFIFPTDHLHRYSCGRHLIETRTNRTFLSKFSLLVFLFLCLFPPIIATTLPSVQITTVHRDIRLFDDFDLNSSISSLPSSRPHWHAGCCIIAKRALLRACDATLNSTFTSTYKTTLVKNSYQIDFLNNETLFCQRYHLFRLLSRKYLATFTYIVVTVGILLNIFVFIVLMCGSLRRTTSFTLFVAITCFDLLSLASSLFAQLFRTVMTFLKASAPFCKMFGIFFLYFRQCSSTALLLIAVERCIVIKYPLCRHTFNKFRFSLLISVMFLFAIPIPFDFMFFTSGLLHCEAFDTIQADHYQLFRGFFTVVSYAMLPFFGISISNFLIIMELKKSRKRLMSRTEVGSIRRFSSK